jgi:hypothetical protein
MKGKKVDPWEKTKAGKADAALDKKLGIKEDSPRDKRIDRAVKGR